MEISIVETWRARSRGKEDKLNERTNRENLLPSAEPFHNRECARLNFNHFQRINTQRINAVSVFPANSFRSGCYNVTQIPNSMITKE